MMTAQATLLTGAPLRRDFGELRFARHLVIDLPCDHDGPVVPLLDNHSLTNPPLGHVGRVWSDEGVLKAMLLFDDTAAGRKAFKMIQREELCGISCGIHATEIAVRDTDGNTVDCEAEPDRHRDPNLVFTVARFELREVSLCAVCADAGAVVRACGSEISDIRRRMAERQQHLPVDEAGDATWQRVAMPGRDLIQYRPLGV